MSHGDASLFCIHLRHSPLERYNDKGRSFSLKAFLIRLLYFGDIARDIARRVADCFRQDIEKSTESVLWNLCR